MMLEGLILVGVIVIGTGVFAWWVYSDGGT